jgi:hypothetical protein
MGNVGLLGILFLLFGCVIRQVAHEYFEPNTVDSFFIFFLPIVYLIDYIRNRKIK